MKQLSVLIKPSSNKCNLKCKYCFYEDVSSSRLIPDYDFMSIENGYKIIDNIFANQELRTVTIGFQGGEQTLIGINFFNKFFAYTYEKR